MPSRLTLVPDWVLKLSVLTGCSAQARKGTGTVLSARDTELPDRFEMAEVEETLKRLQSQKGVQGIIVVNTEATPQDRSVCPFSFGKSEAKRDPLLSSAVTYTGQNKRLKCVSSTRARICLLCSLLYPQHVEQC
ncbi:dynein light chain roadblock-type 1 isoform X2 [Pteropus alecto]|uniref:dynein light chain roadblock-type 1 isoform X2 n=1 Tax=Pteropus alecto TaxID=9402 RepID=UPI000D537180|nr:dynein light chain roadblock-type 1 isoform X2 [Pteropus alecto]